MGDNKVGAGILNIITESLYDDPIVVFREYVQNSMDSIMKSKNSLVEGEIKIWDENKTLFFIDNGKGVEKGNFKDEMTKIGASTKIKQRNMGYKGIGRLSGVPYCKRLYFVNVYDYKNKGIQLYKIDSELYDGIKRGNNYSNLSFEDLMKKIGTYQDKVNIKDMDTEIYKALEKNDEMLKKGNTGFLVILEDISMVLGKIMEDENQFCQKLGWLLPVNFSDDLLQKSNSKKLFKELIEKKKDETVPVQFCNIYYREKKIERPIREEMLRDYVCKKDFKYAVGFHTFKRDKIAIDKNNSFSGIRIYMDNMLLCKENELLQSLEHYGLLEHTLNGQLQSVRGIGAMIYITDKVNISANARRTFIEVTDDDSLEFLRILAEFVSVIYDTRYALSKYMSEKGQESKKLEKLREDALENLKKLAEEDVSLTESEEVTKESSEMTIIEKKKIIKKIIASKLNVALKDYLKQLNNFALNNSYEKFIEWLKRK